MRGARSVARGIRKLNTNFDRKSGEDVADMKTSG